MRPLNLIFLLILTFTCEVAFAQPARYEQGIPERADLSKSISIYPNPAVDFLNVKLGELNAHHARVTLYNILGNEVQAEVEVVEDHEVRVRVKELSTGYYLLAVRDDKTQFRGTYKFLKR
ncbi:MAG TPA: T9SS type A sorting domain-containing protein [Cyclobacteriaceae bacterium]|nr:T9SS type A sorting domain-containing protein [Cyclobacteriaceae bacterium]